MTAGRLKKTVTPQCVSVVVVLIAGSNKEADAGAVRQGLEEGRSGDVQAAADLHGRPQGQAWYESE